MHFPGASALGHAALFQKKAVVAREADEDQELNGEGTHARAMTCCMESSSALSGRSGCAHFIKKPRQRQGSNALPFRTSDLVSTPVRLSTPHRPTVTPWLALCQLAVDGLGVG